MCVCMYMCVPVCWCMLLLHIFVCVHVCTRLCMFKPQDDIQNHPQLIIVIMHLVQWDRVSQSNTKLAHILSLISQLYYIFPVSIFWG